MEWLNYNHLYYFWIVAREMSVTRAARVLRTSQSSISAQLRQLEDSLGHPLFLRRRQRLELTESGRIALDYAQSIFTSGQEMLGVLKGRPVDRRPVLRVGAVGPLSKNLQSQILEPVLKKSKARIVAVQGDLHALVVQLQNHLLDVVISNQPARTEEVPEVVNHRLAEMPVYLVGKTSLRIRAGAFPAGLDGVPLLLPSRQSTVRVEFDVMLEKLGVVPEIRAEVDDMALLRLLALSGVGLALVPEVVVQLELKEKKLLRVTRVPGLREKFYVITARRRIANEALTLLMEQLPASWTKTAERPAKVPGVGRLKGGVKS